MEQTEVVVIGAGPCGLSAAIELQKRGFKTVLLEKQCVVHSIYLYPTYMQFFSTPELLEIGGYPFNTPNEKPNRLEALTYYRNVAVRSGVDLRSYHEVTQLTAEPGGFSLTVRRPGQPTFAMRSKYVVVATGYFDRPNLLGIPGEALPHVSHYFREAHPYSGAKVTIIGGSNSAIDAAMELQRANAQVTVVYRGEAISPSVKPWVRPIYESMVNKGRIRMFFRSIVTNITESSVTWRGPEGEETIDCDFVLALTGFRPDRTLLKQTGAQTTGPTDIPVFHPETMETTVPGLYIAGVAASGENANEVFIETGRNHGVLIAEHLGRQQREKTS